MVISIVNIITVAYSYLMYSWCYTYDWIEATEERGLPASEHSQMGTTTNYLCLHIFIIRKRWLKELKTARNVNLFIENFHHNFSFLTNFWVLLWLLVRAEICLG